MPTCFCLFVHLWLGTRIALMSILAPEAIPQIEAIKYKKPQRELVAADNVTSLFVLETTSFYSIGPARVKLVCPLI